MLGIVCGRDVVQSVRAHKQAAVAALAGDAF
jgi:hypothetical protein